MKKREFTKRATSFLKYLAEKYEMEESTFYWVLNFSNKDGAGKCSYTSDVYHGELLFKPSASFSPICIYNVSVAFSLISGAVLEQEKDLKSYGIIRFGDEFGKPSEKSILNAGEDFKIFEERMENLVCNYKDLVPKLSYFDSLSKLLLKFPSISVGGPGGVAHSIMRMRLFDHMENFNRVMKMLQPWLYEDHYPEFLPLEHEAIKMLDRPEVIEYLRSIARIPNQAIGQPAPPRPWCPTVYNEYEMHWQVVINQKYEKGLDTLIQDLEFEKVLMSEEVYAGDQYMDPDSWYIGENEKGTILICPVDSDHFVDYLNIDTISPLEERMIQIFPDSEILNFHQFLYNYGGYTFLKEGKKHGVVYQSMKDGEVVTEEQGERVFHDSMPTTPETQKYNIAEKSDKMYLRIMGVWGAYNDVIAHTKMVKLMPLNDSLIPASREDMLSENLIKYKKVVQELQDPQKRKEARQAYEEARYELHYGKKTLSKQIAIDFPADEMDWMIVINQKYTGGITALVAALGMNLEQEESAYAGEVYKDTDGWYIGETESTTIIICPYPKSDFANYMRPGAYSNIEEELRVLFREADILSFHQYKEYLNAFSLIRKGEKIMSSMQAVTGPNEELIDHNGETTDEEQRIINESREHEIVTAKLLNHHFLAMTGYDSPYRDDFASIMLRKMK